MERRLSTGKQNLSWTPFAERLIQLFQQSIRHLPFSRNFQRVVILPDCACLAPAVADIIQVENDDREHVQAVKALLDFQLRQIEKSVQSDLFIIVDKPSNHCASSYLIPLRSACAWIIA